MIHYLRICVQVIITELGTTEVAILCRHLAQQILDRNTINMSNKWTKHTSTNQTIKVRAATTMHVLNRYLEPNFPDNHKTMVKNSA